MLKKIKHIATFLLMFIFIAYFIGIDVYHHKCLDTGKNFSKVFEKADCECLHKAKNQKCNTDLTNDCCSQHKDIETSNSQKVDCCIDFVETFVLTSIFLSSAQNEIEIESPLTMVQNSDFYTVNTYSNINKIIELVNNPPPIKRIISFIHTVSTTNDDGEFFIS